MSLKALLILLQIYRATYRQQGQVVKAYLQAQCPDLKDGDDRTYFLAQAGFAEGDFPGGVWHPTEAVQARVNRLQSQVIAIDDPLYPSLWLEMPQPPWLIYYRGHRDLLTQPKVAIVGTRKATPYGRHFVTALVQAMAQRGWVAVSGLAKGIDAQVHQTAMRLSNQATLGIIATGLDQVYPMGHEALQRAVGNHHLLISEFLPDQPARKHHFILRNRLIAGIAPITVVVEAAQQSGSLITANYALQANRELFVLPGRITDKQSRGCIDLIAAGATPITDLDDLLNTMAEILAHHYPF